MRDFTKDFIEKQANEHNKNETFNFELFKYFYKRKNRKCGELNLLGITIPEKFGGCGLDAVFLTYIYLQTAACILLEEISYSDPGFGLSVLAHSILFGNNLAINGNDKQKEK